MACWFDLRFVMQQMFGCFGRNTNQDVNAMSTNREETSQLKVSSTWCQSVHEQEDRHTPDCHNICRARLYLASEDADESNFGKTVASGVYVCGESKVSFELVFQERLLWHNLCS